MTIIGIDLGGTNFRAATFEAGSWTPVDHVKEGVGDRRDPASMVERPILGGGLLGRTPTLYAQVTTALMLAAPVASTERLSIVRAELDDDAGLVGSAALAASGVSIVPRG